MNPTILIAVLSLGALAGAFLRSRAVVASTSALVLAASLLLAQVLSMTMRIGGRTDVSQMMDPVLVALHLAWAVAIAYGIASAARSSHDDCSRRRALTLATMGAALLIAGKFLLFEVGKVRHNQEMEQFFLSSGYPALLHYVVMTLEVAGSLALLVFAKRRIGIAAAVGLGLIMIGAVATHWRNGDPLSDAYDAIAQAIYIVTYLVAAVLAMHGMARTAVHSQAR